MNPTMKKIFLAPFALTGLTLALAGCGGGSTTVNEDPYKGITTTSSGCTSSSAQCGVFYIDYPVSGLNFDCSSNTKEHYQTQEDGNSVTGGCLATDKVNFYIQGATTSRKITFGEIDLAKIRPKKISTQPAPIRLIDIAESMTGKTIQNQSMDDETYRVLVGLVRVFQAVGVEQNVNVAGDLQPIALLSTFKDDLKGLDADVSKADFIDGSYATKLKPWVNLDTVDNATAQKVADQLILMSNVSVYTANFLAASTTEGELGGFYGKTTGTSKKESIANLYLLTDRKGYTSGYAVQWTGVPVISETDTSIGSAVARLKLLTQVPPAKINATGLSNDWFNPFTKKISTPLKLFTPNSTDALTLNQGTLFNDTTVPGTEFLYKFTTNDTKAPVSNDVYGKWNQTLNGENFEGGIDIYKANAVTYLSNQVFKTENNVKSGESYVFPLYANITFNFTDSKTNPSVKLGVVIDENGDIRTNIADPSNSSDLSSNQCPTVDAATMKDSRGVQQYRIGTTGVANFSANDKSITIRMILSNPVFGSLDGVLVGLNTPLIYSPINPTDGIPQYTPSGVRINVQNLVVGKDPSKGINITSWDGQAATEATWGNMLAISQYTYNENNKTTTTPEQVALATRTDGTMTIKVADCYAIKNKS